MPELGGYYPLSLTVPQGTAETVATVVVRDPEGVPIPTELLQVTGGSTAWGVTVPLELAGWYVATWTVTGPGAGVKSSRFYVVDTARAFGIWPPSLADLKKDMGGRDDQDDGKDVELAMTLEAAIDKVRDIKGDVWFVREEESDDTKKLPTRDLILGTLRLAGHWHARRGQRDGTAAAGDLGTAQISGWDWDIDRLLQIGKFTPMSESFA